jgi:hypothetical protein
MIKLKDILKELEVGDELFTDVPGIGDIGVRNDGTAGYRAKHFATRLKNLIQKYNLSGEENTDEEEMMLRAIERYIHSPQYKKDLVKYLPFLLKMKSKFPYILDPFEGAKFQFLYRGMSPDRDMVEKAMEKHINEVSPLSFKNLFPSETPWETFKFLNSFKIKSLHEIGKMNDEEVQSIIDKHINFNEIWKKFPWITKYKDNIDSKKFREAAKVLKDLRWEMTRGGIEFDTPVESRSKGLTSFSTQSKIATDVSQAFLSPAPDKIYGLVRINADDNSSNLLFNPEFTNIFRNEDEVILVGNKFQADRFHPQHGTFDILRNY